MEGKKVCSMCNVIHEDAGKYGASGLIPDKTYAIGPEGALLTREKFKELLAYLREEEEEAERSFYGR